MNGGRARVLPAPCDRDAKVWEPRVRCSTERIRRTGARLVPMAIGRYLNELARLRVASVLCLLVAAFAGLSVSHRVSVAPPGLEPREVETASATAEILVDTAQSTLVDTRQGATDIEQMTNRAVLIGNVMASPFVVDYIARRARVAPSAIRVQAPLTPDFPRPVSQPGEAPKASDLLRSPDEYRLNIQGNPSVPILKIYAQAPTARAAATLANASVDGLRDYIRSVARAKRTDPVRQVSITQLGRATGTTINDGVAVELSVLAFLLVLAIGSAASIFVARVHRGWTQARAEWSVPPRAPGTAVRDAPSDEEPDPRTRARATGGRALR